MSPPPIEPGGTFSTDLTDVPAGASVECGIRELPSRTMITALSSTDIVETPDPDDADLSTFTATREAPDVPTQTDEDGPRYVVVFTVNGVEQDPEDLVVLSLWDLSSFATVDQVAARLGRGSSSANPLNEDETAMVEQLIATATALIAEAASKDDVWAAALSPVPGPLKAICIEVVVRAMANPNGLTSFREQLGAHSYAQNFKTEGGGLMLTKVEELLVRRVVYGRTTDAAKVPSAFRHAERLLRRGQQDPVVSE